MTTYESLIEDWGYEVASWESFGDYQGDYAVLLKDGDRYGWLVIGYGSCSGCDALEAAYDSPKALTDLSNDLRNEVRWNTALGLADWLANKYRSLTEWAWSEPGFKEHVDSIIERLRANA